MDATILVNRSHRLSRNAIPQLLVEPEIFFDAPAGDARRLLEASAAKAAEKLFARGKEEGIYLCGISGYRSYERQEMLYRAKAEQQEKEAPVLWVAPPGASEHQTGLALDVSCQAVGYELEERFAETKEGRWLKRCAPLFGFILRYPKGKEHITGYGWEPWHIRYVTRSLALYLTLTGLTLEEYYETKSIHWTNDGYAM